MIGFIKVKNEYHFEQNIKRYYIILYHDGISIELETIGKHAALDTLRMMSKTICNFHYDEDITEA